MTEAQKASVSSFLSQYDEFMLGHGLCVGADVQAHDITKSLSTCLGVIGFPAKDVGPKAANMPESEFLVLHPKKQPLLRNLDIVVWGELLLATPKEAHMVARSGTWTTVRYALKDQKPVFIVMPSGLIVPW
jgi:hypothetical protein